MRIRFMLTGRVYLSAYLYLYLGGYFGGGRTFVLFDDSRPGGSFELSDAEPGTDSPCRRSPSAKPWRKWGDGGQSRRLAAMPLRPP